MAPAPMSAVATQPKTFTQSGLVNRPMIFSSFPILKIKNSRRLERPQREEDQDGVLEIAGRLVEALRYCQRPLILPKAPAQRAGELLQGSERADLTAERAAEHDSDDEDRRKQDQAGDGDLLDEGVSSQHRPERLDAAEGAQRVHAHKTDAAVLMEHPDAGYGDEHRKKAPPPKGPGTLPLRRIGAVGARAVAAAWPVASVRG